MTLSCPEYFDYEDFSDKHVTYKERHFVGRDAEDYAQLYALYLCASNKSTEFALEYGLKSVYFYDKVPTETGVLLKFWMAFVLPIATSVDLEKMELGTFINMRVDELVSKCKHSRYILRFEAVEPFSYVWRCVGKTLKEANSEFTLSSNGNTFLSGDPERLISLALGGCCNYALRNEFNKQIALFDTDPANEKRRVFVDLDYQFLFDDSEKEFKLYTL
jgi:hypothetical protein